MKAILVNEDKTLRWDSVPDPVCGPEDCLVKIEAAALNRADLMQREGDYPPPPGCPEWMGLEIAGTVTEVGPEAAEKSNWKVGDKVCALLGGGGYAEYANVKYDMLMPVPEKCSMVEAAAIPEAFATAYLNLFIEGGAKAGDVDGVGNTQHPADQAAVDIGFDGVSNGQIGSELLYKLSILPQKAEIRHRIDAPAVDGRIVEDAARCHQRIHQLTVGQRNMHFMFGKHRFDQILAELIQAHIIVG
jgi:NADPH:quinone reductase-like Zn-dependent oxidoreductase